MEALRGRQGELSAELETARAGQVELEAQTTGANEREAKLREELAELRSRQTNLTAESEAAAQREAEANAKLESAAGRQEELSAELESARTKQAKLAGKAEAAAGREAESSAQLEALRGRQGELSAELETAKARQAELEAQTSGANQREAKAREELTEIRSRQTDLTAELEAAAQREAEANARIETIQARQTDLSAELETANQHQAGSASELESLRTECDRLRRAAESAPSGGGETPEEFGALRAERDRLAENLADTEARMAGLVEQLSRAEEQLEKASEASIGEGGDEELQRRHEMALDDIRELKSKNEALQEELSQAQVAGGATTSTPAGSLDWEAEKRRILAELDSEFDEDDQEDQAVRLEIEDVVNKTQQAISEKDREIGELQELLDKQSSNIGSVAVGAAAIGEMLDQDAVIMEERENLRQLQAKWEDKLRKAEIDLSVERAKIAREKAEIKEKFAAIEKLGVPAGDEADSPEKPARGRWLSRLGLQDDDDSR